MQNVSELMRGNDLIVAPVALNPIMARLAEEAGFKAVYLSSGHFTGRIFTATFTLQAA